VLLLLPNRLLFLLGGRSKDGAGVADAIASSASEQAPQLIEPLLLLALVLVLLLLPARCCALLCQLPAVGGLGGVISRGLPCRLAAIVSMASPMAGAVVSSGWSSSAVTPLARQPPHVVAAADASDASDAEKAPPVLIASAVLRGDGGSSQLLLLLPLSMLVRVTCLPAAVASMHAAVSSRLGSSVSSGEPSKPSGPDRTAATTDDGAAADAAGDALLRGPLLLTPPTTPLTPPLRQPPGCCCCCWRRSRSW
jgi:hypothetical protein